MPVDSYYADKEENEIFLIYKEIQMGSVVQSYMRKGFLIYEVAFFPDSKKKKRVFCTIVKQKWGNSKGNGCKVIYGEKFPNL